MKGSNDEVDSVQEEVNNVSRGMESMEELKRKLQIETLAEMSNAIDDIIRLDSA